MATTQSISPLFSPQTIRRSQAENPARNADDFRRIDAEDYKALLAAEARFVRRAKKTKKAVQR